MLVGHTVEQIGVKCFWFRGPRILREAAVKPATVNGLFPDRFDREFGGCETTRLIVGFRK